MENSNNLLWIYCYTCGQNMNHIKLRNICRYSSYLCISPEAHQVNIFKKQLENKYILCLF